MNHSKCKESRDTGKEQQYRPNIIKNIGDIIDIPVDKTQKDINDTCSLKSLGTADKSTVPSKETLETTSRWKNALLKANENVRRLEK